MFSECYDEVLENSTTGAVSFHYTDDTVRFRALHENVSRCFNDSDFVSHN